MKNVLVVSNFNAGRKQAINYKKNIHKFLFKNAEKFKFIAIDELDNIDLSEYDTILTMGGDGTVNRLIPYVINTDKVLGIIPCGTANLLAAKLKIPTEIKKIIKVFKKNKIKKIDAMQINNSLGILRYGLGYDSDIICKTPQSLKNKFGYFSYFVAGCLFALRLKNKNYKLILKKNEIEKTIDINASCIIVANAGNMYKNIVSIAKKNKLTDGLLDVFILRTQNPIIFFFEFLRILLGIKTNNNRAKYLKTQEITIENNFCYAHIDGEKVKEHEDIKIKVIPSAIYVLSN